MIEPRFRCNICRNPIAYDSWSGMDGIELRRAGPPGNECERLEAGDSRYPSPAGEIHICRRCEGGLETFFKERSLSQ